MTIAKQGLVICEMIDRGWVQAIVTTGALMTHGLVESRGHACTSSTTRPCATKSSMSKGYNRVYDTIELEQNLDDTEMLILGEILDPVPDDDRAVQPRP